MNFSIHCFLTENWKCESRWTQTQYNKVNELVGTGGENHFTQEGKDRKVLKRVSHAGVIKRAIIFKLSVA